jgi:putative ATP-binding cassette transporter
LITGLYPPESGQVLYNDITIDSQNRDQYRQIFSTVFLDFHLFNSFLGLEDENLEEKARAYLKKLQIDHKVEIKGNELSTVNLSQGQRKRLAMLTAYLEDRPFYVFDEWTANQDPSFRDFFYQDIVPDLRARGKGVIAITHDDKFFDVADRIVKLDYGQVDLNAKTIEAMSPVV